MKRIALSYLIILWGALSAPSFASEASSLELFELINQRLSYMKDVAAHKWVNDKPIEDLERETIVLQKSMAKAKKEGLNASSVEAFFIAQITVAKNIQKAWHKEWEQKGFPLALEFEDLQAVRKSLISLGSEILASIKPALPSLHNEKERTALTQDFKRSITTEKVTEKDILLIFDGLVQIKAETLKTEL